MSKLIVVGGSSISGAEIVLKDYLNKTQEKFILLTSEEIYKTNYFDANNVKVIGLKELNFLGTSKKRKIIKLFMYLKKILNIYFVSKEIERISKENNLKILLLNNSTDIIYLSFFKSKIKIVSYVHDMLEKKGILSKFIKFNDRKVNKYITVSEASKNSLCKLINDKDKIQRIYNGINLKEIKEKQVKNNFLFVGMINERKNPIEFLEFLEEFQKKDKNYSAKIIYKYYEEELLYQMKERIKNNNLNVEFLYFLTQREVEKEMEKANYLFLCSKRDPLPTVILEAMNNSMVIIAKNVDGVKEMVINKKTGYLYDDKSEWCDLILEIKEMNHIKYKRIINSSMKSLKEKFNNDEKVKKLDNILDL